MMIIATMQQAKIVIIFPLLLSVLNLLFNNNKFFIFLLEKVLDFGAFGFRFLSRFVQFFLQQKLESSDMHPVQLQLQITIFL